MLLMRDLMRGLYNTAHLCIVFIHFVSQQYCSSLVNYGLEWLSVEVVSILLNVLPLEQRQDVLVVAGQVWAAV